MNKLDEARSDLEQAQKLNAQLSEIYIVRARINLQSHNVNQAISDVNELSLIHIW